jgi:diguanylate cyclase (GGDEF)-like protein
MIELELEQKHRSRSHNIVLISALFFQTLRVSSELMKGEFRTAAIIGGLSAIAIGIFFLLKKMNSKNFPFMFSFFMYTFYIGASFAVESFKYFYVYYVLTLIICAIYFNVGNFLALLVITQITNLWLGIFVLPKHFKPIDADIFVYSGLTFCASMLIFITMRSAVDRSNVVSNAFNSFGALMKVTPNALILTDENNKIKYMSHSVCKVFGIRQKVANFIEKNFLELFDEDSVKEVFADIAKNRSYYENYQKIEVGEQVKTFDVVAGKMSDNAADGMFFMFNEVSDLIKLKELAEQESHTDALTQIPNRRAFEKRIAHEWDLALKEQVNLSFLMLDIDFFKKYNDTYGHKQGDELLKLAANVFKRCLKKSDLVARLGGEEFGVLLYAINSNQASIVAEKIRKAVEEEAIFTTSGEQIGFTVSIGVCSVVPNAELKISSLIEEADKALYKAKDSGRNRVCLAM